MGYTTEFDGRFDLNPALTPAQVQYLDKFSRTRRMKRYSSIIEEMPDPIREAVGLPIGTDGEYFVGSEVSMGQDCDIPSIVNYGWDAPSGQPGLWCQWIPSQDGKSLEWDGNEKFYDYVEWLEYIIKHFLVRWSVRANGCVTYCGEESSDTGIITVVNNTVK